MACTVNLRTDYKPSVSVGGSWEFVGYNSSSSSGPFNSNDPSGNFNIGDTYVGDNPSLNLDDFSGGYYQFSYTLTNGSCEDESLLTLEIAEFCFPQNVFPGDSEPSSYIEIEVCYDAGDDSPSTLNLYNILNDDTSCTLDTSTFDLIFQNPSDSHLIPNFSVGAWNSSTYELDLSYIYDDNPIAEGSSRSYGFFVRFNEGAFNNFDASGCGSCVGFIALNIKISPSVMLIEYAGNPNYGEFSNPVVAGISPAGDGNNNFGYPALEWPSIIQNESTLDDLPIQRIYYGEGPDVGGCGTTAGVLTSSNQTLNAYFGNTSASLGSSFNCGDLLGTLLFDIDTNYEISLSLLPTGIHAFHYCTGYDESCLNCQTVYVESTCDVHDDISLVANATETTLFLITESPCSDIQLRLITAPDGTTSTSTTIPITVPGIYTAEYICNGCDKAIATYEYSTLSFNFISDIGSRTLSPSTAFNKYITDFYINGQLVTNSTQLWDGTPFPSGTLINVGTGQYRTALIGTINNLISNFNFNNPSFATDLMFNPSLTNYCDDVGNNIDQNKHTNITYSADQTFQFTLTGMQATARRISDSQIAVISTIKVTETGATLFFYPNGGVTLPPEDASLWLSPVYGSCSYYYNGYFPA